MKWNKYTIKTITDAEDIISATLGEIGVEGVQIEDKIPLSKRGQRKNVYRYFAGTSSR